MFSCDNFTGDNIVHRLVYKIFLVPVNQELARDVFEQKLKEIFNECADMNRWDLQDFSFHEGVARLVIQLDPEVSLDKAISILKKVSTSLFEQDYPQATHKELYEKNSLWQQHYVARTIGDLKAPLCAGQDCINF